MTVLTVGQRLPLSSLSMSEAQPLSVSFERLSSTEVDISCFALDDAGKLISDDYMVFYNQTKSPCQRIALSHYESSPSSQTKLHAVFDIELSKLPSNVSSLFFVMSADTPLNRIQSVKATVQQGSAAATATYLSSDFANQQASMFVQLYRKGGVWRISNVCQGFDGGLAAIVGHFGGDVAGEPETVVPAKINTTKPSIEKVMLEKAPKLVSLAKKATISLEKKNLQNLTARVALVLDASGSMNSQYRNGHVQEVINRLLPLAVGFDDDQALDCWAFGAQSTYLGDITLDNYENFVKEAHGGWESWKVGSRVNNEVDAMRQVILHYQAEGGDTPVYVLFISDGGVHDNRGITKAVVDAAKLPIFWQFVGLGGNDYGILERLDDMTDRFIDNCNFFALDRLSDVSEDALYDMMLEEFPSWLKEARQVGLIRQA